VALLDPDITLRADLGVLPSTTPRLVRGAQAVAKQALMFARLSREGDSRPALVNGSIGLVTAPGGVVRAVMGLTIADGRIVEIDILADPDRLARLDLAALDR
jgi:RNA polymerase sigma-70 factor, ECF subfamily